MKIREMWRKISPAYKTLGALAFGTAVSIAGDNMINNRAYAKFDPRGNVVEYKVLDTDGISCPCQILDENGKVLVYVYSISTPDGPITTKLDGQLKLHSGYHELFAVYTDEGGNIKNRKMTVTIPKS